MKSEQSPEVAAATGDAPPDEPKRQPIRDPRRKPAPVKESPNVANDSVINIAAIVMLLAMTAFNLVNVVS